MKNKASQADKLTRISKGKGGEKFEEPNGIAVGPDGRFYVSQEEEVFEFNNEERNRPTAVYEAELGLTATRAILY